MAKVSLSDSDAAQLHAGALALLAKQEADALNPSTTHRALPQRKACESRSARSELEPMDMFRMLTFCPICGTTLDIEVQRPRTGP